MNRNVIIVKALKMDMKRFRDWTLPRFVHGQGEKEKHKYLYITISGNMNW